MKAHANDLHCPACDVVHTYYYVKPDPGEVGEAPILEWASYNHLAQVSELESFPPQGTTLREVPSEDLPYFSDVSDAPETSVTWPIRCPTCGKGEVVPTARVGRTAKYKSMTALPLPDDLAIPTCGSCSAEWIDRPTAEAIDAALEREYQSRLRALAVTDLQKLAARRVTQRRLEQLLGLSQGYLSKIRSGASRPSAALVSCLHLLAGDPERRLREMEESFAPA